MMPVIKKQNRGFTLTEMLIYLAILLVLSTSVVSLLLSLRGLMNLYLVDQQVTKNAQIAMERMMHELREADNIDTIDPDTTLITSPGHLVLLRGATTTEFYLSNNQIFVSINDVEQGPLTSDEVIVNELRFFSYDNLVTESIRVRFTLTAAMNGATSTETFTNTAVMRGSYGG